MSFTEAFGVERIWSTVGDKNLWVETPQTLIISIFRKLFLALIKPSPGFINCKFADVYLQEYNVCRFYLQVTMFDTFQNENQFVCSISYPKAHQILRNVLGKFRKAWRRTRIKRKTESWISSTKSSKNSKWHYLDLPMQRELNAYSGLQKVAHLQLFNVNF